MNIKSLVIIVAVLAALSATVYFVNRPKPAPSQDARVGQPLVETKSLEALGKLTITDQGKSVTVAKQSNGTWTVPAYHDFPADFQKLSNFINELSNATIEQFVTGRPEKLARLEFKDTQIRLADSNDKPLVELTLGKNAEAGGRFVRFGNEQKGYRAKLNAWLDAEAKNWADTSLVSLKADDVSKVEITFTEGAPVIASRAKKEDPFTAENTPDGQQLAANKITSAISSAGSLRFSETTDLADANAVAAKQNARTVKFTTFDGKTVTVVLGRKPEQKIIKPPAPKTDGTTGPAALGSVAELAKKEGAAADTKDGKTDAPAVPKLAEPETETIPAGPVFAFVTHSDAGAPVNGLMSKRAFQVYEWAFTSLPQKREELFEAKPAAAPAPAATGTPPTTTANPPSAAAPAAEAPKN
jgi:hypothetical protein